MELQANQSRAEGRRGRLTDEEEEDERSGSDEESSNREGERSGTPRPELSESLLDIEDKRKFIEKMKFKVSVPFLVVRISHSYFAKLSALIRQNKPYNMKMKMKRD